jgi:preprotein translocase subunit SecB
MKMSRIVHVQGSKEMTPFEEEQFLQVSRALSIAAERIAENAYDSQLKAHVKKGRKKSTFRFTVPQEQLDVIQNLKDYQSHKIDANEAMSILHTYDVDNARFVDCKEKKRS